MTRFLVVHRGPRFIQFFCHEGKNVHTMPKHPKTKTCGNNGHKCKGLEVHASLKFFLPLQEAHYPRAQSKKEIMKLKHIGVKLTFLAIFFCNGKHPISFANVKHQILNKHMICLVIFFVGVCGPK